MDVVLLIAGLLSVAFVANGFSPRRKGWPRVPSFFASWWTMELAPQWLLAIVVLVAAGASFGGLDGLIGWLGLVLLVGAAVGLLGLIREARRTTGVMRGVVSELGPAVGAASSQAVSAASAPTAASAPALASESASASKAKTAPRSGSSTSSTSDATGATSPSRSGSGTSSPEAPRPSARTPGYPFWPVAVPVLMGRRRGTQKLRDLTYSRVAGRSLKLDLTLSAKARPGDQRPVLLYLHGGAWSIGDKRHQGLPLMNHMAARGWVAIGANYRLSPAATFPDHLIDAKRALAWIRSHIADYGGDPNVVAVAGSSAGGHLATMVGLTPNSPKYQPGFEAVDTAVQAAVSIYGAYDLTNRLGTWSPSTFRRLIEPWVIKGFLAEQPELFEAASPIDQVIASAAPMLIVHGNRDTVVPVEDARLFAQKLRAASKQPVLYAELAGAQHAFDIFPSIRTASVIEGIERFLIAVI